MNPYCKYCPPPHFEIHNVCHFESVRFKANTRALRSIKENITFADLTLIAQKKLQLDRLFQLSTNETEYKYLAKIVRRFNNVVEIFLRLITRSIRGQLVVINPNGFIRRHFGRHN